MTPRRSFWLLVAIVASIGGTVSLCNWILSS